MGSRKVHTAATCPETTARTVRGPQPHSAATAAKPLASPASASQATDDPAQPDALRQKCPIPITGKASDSSTALEDKKDSALVPASITTTLGFLAV